MKQNDKDSDRAIMAMPRSRRHNHKTDVKDESRRMEVELTFETPQAERVFLAGDFNHWRAGDLRLRRDETGTWRIPLWLAPGRYRTDSSSMASGRTTPMPQPVCRMSLAPATVCS